MQMNSTNKAEVEHREAVPIDIEKGETAVAIEHNHQQQQQHGAVGHQKKVANPLAIGFGAFGLASFVIGITNTGIITNLPQGALPVALGFGAMGQFIGGMGELLLGNTFGGTSMLTYSGFFFSYGIMFSNSTGVFGALETNMTELENVIGLWQIAFCIPSFIFFFCTFKQPRLISLVLLQVFLTFFFGGVGTLTGVHGLTQAGGWLSFTLAITAWYVMAAMLLEEEKVVRLPFF